MQNYHDLMSHILEQGQFKPNRTGVGTFASVGHMLKFDLREGFPAITTKKLAFNSMKGELLSFFRGYDNAADFRALGCKVWDQNANDTQSWVNNPARRGTDDLGRIYSVQFTKWRDTRIVYSQRDADALQAKDYELKAFDPVRNTWVYERCINQYEDALRTLLKDPYNRRIIIGAWRPDELDQMALPPCHLLRVLSVMPDGTLHSTMTQRSQDQLLGTPFNLASEALLVHVMARLAGLKVGTLSVAIADAHIYENHVDRVKLQLSRAHMKAPTLMLSDNIHKVERQEDVKGVFERIQPEDIWLQDYQSHPAISAPMAA